MWVVTVCSYPEKLYPHTFSSSSWRVYVFPGWAASNNNKSNSLGLSSIRSSLIQAFFRSLFIESFKKLISSGSSCWLAGSCPTRLISALVPGYKFAYSKRLGNIIVCAKFQGKHLVNFLAPGGQHKYWCGYLIITDVAANSHAIYIRKHDVQYDQVIINFSGLFAAVSTAFSCGDFIIMCTETFTKQCYYFRVIFNKQYISHNSCKRIGQNNIPSTGLIN